MFQTKLNGFERGHFDDTFDDSFLVSERVE